MYTYKTENEKFEENVGYVVQHGRVFIETSIFPALENHIAKEGYKKCNINLLLEKSGFDASTRFIKSDKTYIWLWFSFWTSQK